MSEIDFAGKARQLLFELGIDGDWGIDFDSHRHCVESALRSIAQRVQEETAANIFASRLADNIDRMLLDQVYAETVGAIKKASADILESEATQTLREHISRLESENAKLSEDLEGVMSAKEHESEIRADERAKVEAERLQKITFTSSDAAECAIRSDERRKWAERMEKQSGIEASWHEISSAITLKEWAKRIRENSDE